MYGHGIPNQYGARHNQPYLLVREAGARSQFETENEDLGQRKSRKGPRRGQGGAAYSVNNYMHESYDEPNSGAYGQPYGTASDHQDVFSRFGNNMINSQIIVDEYGEEIYPSNSGYGGGSISQTGNFLSDSRPRNTRGKNPEEKKKSRKQKRAKHRKKYSSEEENYDEDLNQRELFGRGPEGEAARSEGSSESDSSSDSSMSSSGSSASKKQKRKEQKAKAILEKANKTRK